MNAQEISIPILSYSVTADLYENTGANSVLLVFVGFGSSKERQAEFVSTIVQRANAYALVVDLSGQGKSSFAMDETMPAQHLMEAVLVYDWLVAKYPELSVRAMGTSYGGFIAGYLTRFRIIERLILRTPAIYRPEDFYTLHQYIDKTAARFYRTETELLRHHPLFIQPALGTPKTLVVVHGEDESVPHETTDLFIDNFSATSYMAEGFVHRFRDPSNPQDAVDSYYGAIVDWLV